MSSGLDSPYVVFIVSLVAQWLAAYSGDFFRKKVRQLTEDEREDFNAIQAATLTLLALILGFSFSMAVTRYDQRKNYEEAEANAIGTAHVRADLLPAEDAVRARKLLRRYLDQRIAFYQYRARDTKQIDADTAKLQAELWSAVLRPANAQPNAVVALAVSGMNDVLNSQRYTQAAWLNRIPFAAWALMGLVAGASNFLVGYGERSKSTFILVVLPTIISVSLYLVADIDSPRGGIIRVLPHNLILLSESTKTQ